MVQIHTYRLDKYGVPTLRKFAYRDRSWNLDPAINEESLYTLFIPTITDVLSVPIATRFFASNLLW